MSNTEIMEELCGIIAAQSRIIAEQDAALRQVGAVIGEEPRAAADEKLAKLGMEGVYD